MDDKGKELCPRLIDYLVVVGRRCRSRGASHAAATDQPHVTVSHPDILRRYPTDDHRDFILPTDVTFFCQPEGCTTLAGRRAPRQTRDAQFFVFMLTEKDSAKIRYGICLNFFQTFERTPRASAGAGAPRAGASASARGAAVEPSPTRPPNTLNMKQRRDQARSLTSLCLISHHPFISIFHDLLVLLKKTIDACNARLHGLQQPKDILWSVLTGHWSEAIPPDVLREMRQVETWILMLLSSPVPVPGKTKVHLEVMPPEICGQFEFALPDHTRFSLVDFPLHLPFELLGVDAALRVLSAVMLEYKVVLQSRNYNAVSMCVLSLVALLYPLEYMFPVIPLLPAYMPSAEQLLLAPTPFLIGVPASFFAAKRIKDLPNDVMLVDLDTNIINIPEDLELPDLPEPDASELKKNLRQAIGRMNSGSRAELGRQASVDVGVEIDADEVDVACRVAMVKFYNSPNVFGHFSEHTRTLRLYPRPVVSLQTDSFLRSRPACSQFTSELCKTQAVEYFAECCLCPKNETFVRVQNGIEAAANVGDKIRWFGDQLMPVHFKVYPDNSTLSQSLITYEYALNALSGGSDSELEEASSLSAPGHDPSGSCSSIDDLVFESPDDASVSSRADRPITSVNDVYKEPLRLELPESESALSIASSVSSGSPSSSMSASAIDSEADFARLADNLALKSDARGAFSFSGGHADDASSTMTSPSLDQTPVISHQNTTVAGTPCPAAGAFFGPSSHRPLLDLRTAVLPPPPEYHAADMMDSPRRRPPSLSEHSSMKLSSVKQRLSSLADTPSNGGTPTSMLKSGLSHLSDSSERVLGQQFMSAINGYAEKSSGIFSQVLNRTAPKAQALRDRTVKPIAAAAANRMEQTQHVVRTKATPPPTSIQTASQQGKNQQLVRDVCDGVLAGQGVGVFTYPKLKRLMEDEALRELACAKLNLGLEHRLAEDDYAKEIQLTRAQYKGYVRVLQACISGLEVSFNTPGSNGLASMFHVLEIAHTHFWSREQHDVATPVSAGGSLVCTPSASTQDLNSLTSTRYKIATDGRSPVPQRVPPTAATASATDSGATTATATATTANGHAQRADGPPSAPPPPAGPPPSLPPRPADSGGGGAPPIVGARPRPPPPLLPPPSLPPPTASAPPPSARPPPLPPRRQATLAKPPDAPMATTTTASTTLDSNGNNIKTEPPPQQPAPLVSPPNSLPSLASPPVAPTVSSAPAAAPVQAPVPTPQRKMTAPMTLDVHHANSGSGRGSTTPCEPTRHYIYQDLILPSPNPLWQKMVFWENVFVDIVAQEREIIGMDQEPSEMIDRYTSLADSERKRLELEEDRLLSTLLHNLTAYMIMCGTGQKAIQQKIRRLLGKAHIGLVCSKTINSLLDELPQVQGNSIPLKPLGSRLVQKQSFTVHVGASADGTMMFMEVCDDAVVLRAVTGAVAERWWYERLVNMTYSPKTRVLCLWRRHDDTVHMHQFYSKKCRELYACMKGAMRRAATRGRVNVEGRDLGGEFPVHDTECNEGGLLQVRIDGVAVVFFNRQHFIELGNIKKCNTFGGNVFVLEEYDRKKGELIQRRYISQMAREIAWSLHRVFSVRLAMSLSKPAAPPAARSPTSAPAPNSSSTLPPSSNGGPPPARLLPSPAGVQRPLPRPSELHLPSRRARPSLLIQ